MSKLQPRTLVWKCNQRTFPKTPPPQYSSAARFGHFSAGAHIAIPPDGCTTLLHRFLRESLLDEDQHADVNRIVNRAYVLLAPAVQAVGHYATNALDPVRPGTYSPHNTLANRPAVLRPLI